MGDLEKYLPEETETVKRIYEWHEQREADGANDDPHKGRLGASVIGRPCERSLWYMFRTLGRKKFAGRLLRLFETGHLEEPRFVRELRGIGCTVHDVDEETGKQFEFTALGGHFVCHPDAVILGVPEAPKAWHVGEFKTMGGTETQKSKDFEKVKESGVKLAKPEHFSQCMIGMGLTKTKRALYLCKKKATDEIHSERLRFDSVAFGTLMERAERIIRSISAPDRCTSRPDDFRCKFCDHYTLCWNSGDVAVPLTEITCRTCCHATPEVDEGESWARWSCSQFKKDLNLSEQREACNGHLLLPCFVQFATPTDSNSVDIEFTNNDDEKAVWWHGNKEGMWSTEELMRTPGPLVGQKSVEGAKKSLGATVTGVDPAEPGGDLAALTLIERYPPSECRKLWDGEPEECKEAVKSFLGLTAVHCGVGDVFEDDEYLAAEYDGKFLVVIYKEHNHAAIWEGVE